MKLFNAVLLILSLFAVASVQAAVREDISDMPILIDARQKIAELEAGGGGMSPPPQPPAVPLKRCRGRNVLISRGPLALRVPRCWTVRIWRGGRVRVWDRNARARVSRPRAGGGEAPNVLPE
eukprot:Polyplicarium_translucidae@DN3357_c0_g1_i6.p3